MLDKNLQRIKISQVIGSQLPDFVADDNPLFVEFLEQYYTSQEYQGGPTDISENIDKYLNLENFQEENYLTSQTKLNGSITYYDDVITVDSTKSWPSEYGLLKIGNEIITYTGKTDTTFTGCVRGFSGIENLHATNNPEFLVFSSSTSSDHDDNSTVLNLSNLFLKEFWKKLKIQFLPGFENREFTANLDKAFFLSRAKDFYSSKGTDESFKILFKVLYADNVNLVKPQEFLIRPSSADWLVTKNIVVEQISGDPLKLNGQTLRQDSPPASGQIFSTELYSLDQNFYYLMRLSNDSIFGEFSLNGFTKNTKKINEGDTIITVDSTLGFTESGSLYVDGQVITYTEKSSTQFLGCSGITNDVGIYSNINQNNFVYSYEDGDLTKKVVLRITGTLSDYDLQTSTDKYLLPNDQITVKTLGEQIKKGDYNSKFDYWLYNPCIDIELIDTTDKFSSETSPTFVRTKVNHNLRRGDSVTLLTSGLSEINGSVTDVLYESDADKINNVSKRFEFTFTGALNRNLQYTLRKNVNSANSALNPSVNGIFANIQNTYIDNNKESLYVTSTGLPSYSITSDDRSSTFSVESETDTISTVNSHHFYTGQKVYLTSLSGYLTGISTDFTYFVKKITNNTFKLSYSLSRIDNQDYISFSGIGTHKVTPFELHNKVIQDQRIFKKIPINPLPRKTNSDNLFSTVGLFVNGVEIKSNESGDVVYYGQLNSIDVLNSGSGYNVIHPPKVIITDTTGSGSEANLCVSGKIDSIDVINPGQDFDEVPSVTILGGNGRNATAEARLKSVQFSINFSASSTGINTTSNTIGFSTYHTFKSGEEVIYNSENNEKIGIALTSGLTSVDSYLIDNSSYFVRVINDKTIQLTNTFNDAIVGVNTVEITKTGSGTHKLISKKLRKVIDSIRVTNSGEDYQNNPVEVESLKYPPSFPGISTAIVGINTVDNYIFAKNHGFETGEEIVYSTTGSPISGISTDKVYYAIKLDESKFQLSEKIVGVSTITGIGTTATNENLLNNTHVPLNSLGSGKHTFNYPPIQVVIGGVVKSLNSYSQPSAIVNSTGSIKKVFLKNGGSNYGSSIMNYEKQPTIKIFNGSGALLRPVVIDGVIDSVYVLNGGSGYVAAPHLIVKGVGKYANLKAIIVDGEISSVEIIDGGEGYDQRTTSIEIDTLGKNAKLSANIQIWNVNSYYKYEFGDDDGILIENFDQNFGLQFASVYAPKKLRRILNDNLTPTLDEIGIGSAHSPIIGWSYDGNPIYGPYGGSNPTSISNSRILQSGYSLINKSNRPDLQEFPQGFFIEDYEYTADGDLDEHNGRYCVTPEFPNGVYAYFSTVQNFPYVIRTFKNNPDPFNFNLVNNQNSNLLVDGSLSRNISPYRLEDFGVNYNGLDVSNKKKEKFAVNSIYNAGISSVKVIDPGNDYKVGDYIRFDNSGSGGEGALGQVELIEGKDIHSISYSENIIKDVSFVYSGNTIVAISTLPHNISNDDTILISGISNPTFKFFEGSHKATVSSVETSVQEQISNVATTGIITSIRLAESTSSGRLCVDDIIKIGTEQMLIIKINNDSESYTVERGFNSSTSSSHSQGSKVELNSKRVKYTVNNSKVKEVIRENKVTYFNPVSSVGLGTSGTKYFVGYGISFTTVGIATGTTTRLFFNSHTFNPSDFVEVIGGSPAGINVSEARVTSVGSTYINIEHNTSSSTSVSSTATVLLKKYNFIGAKSIYVPCLSCGCESIPFQTFEPFLYSSNSGSGIVVSEYDDLSNSFSLQDNQIIYVTRLSEASNTLGIRTSRTGIGSLSTLYIVGTGSGNKHSLRTVNPVVSGTIKKYSTSVFTQDPHGISGISTVTINLTSNRTEDATLRYNSKIEKIVVNPSTFASASIGVGITVSTIYLQNHSFKTGDKVVYEAQNPATPLENNKVYYVIKSSDDYIRLANTYSDCLKDPPSYVAITNAGSGTHSISLINPKLNFTRGNTIGFGVSDISLTDFDLRFYLDNEFKNEYSNNVTKVGVSGDTNSSTKINLNTDENTPEILYYQLTKKNISVGSDYDISVDKEVIDFCKIIISPSVYQSTFSVSGIGSTELKITSIKKPEHNLYNSSNTSELKYSTDSKSASGGIDKIKLLFEGYGYEKLPKVSSVTSENGNGAIVRSYSDQIGKIKSVSALNIGYNYSSDKTIRPKADLPTILRVSNNFTLNKVGIESGGRGYLSPPTPVVVGYPNILLSSQLNGTSVASVSILISNENISESSPTIVSTKNSNGIVISKAESDGTFNTITLKRPANGFSQFPFIVGDKIFVEGIQTLNTYSNGGGYNSSNYNYQTFEITSFINDENISSLTYRIPVGLGTTGGIFDSSNSNGRVILESDLAKFNASIIEQNFYEDEIVNTIDGASFRIAKNGWDSGNKLLKVVNVNGSLSVGSTILGNSSKAKAKIVDIEYLDGKFNVGPFVKKINGWQDSVGVTNDYFQRIHDSFYYQYFSYEIDGVTPYFTWQEPVNSLAHPSGFKAFSKLNVFSNSSDTASVSVGSSNISILIDINNVASLYTKSNYDFASEITNNVGSSKLIRFASKKIVSFTKSLTNKSILLDDISSQFNGITTTLGGNVVGLSSFKLTSENDDVLHITFNSSILTDGSTIINLPNHNFNNGEKLIYDPGPGGTLIGIATTNRVLSGVSTDLLPNEVFAYKVNSNQIKLSGIKTDSTVNNIFFTFRKTSGNNVALGRTHSFSIPSDLANTRSLITIDNIIQSPLYRKNINVGLSSQVGIGSTVISFFDTKNITSNSLLQIDSEILKVNTVGFGTTTDVSVTRGQMNTVAAAHTVGAAVTVLGGDYTISDGSIYFTTPPYGPVGVSTLQPGISTNSTFSGRIFYRVNYDTNYIFDDISDQFTGNVSTGKTFILKSNSNNISNISANNGIILVNNIFQRPVGVTSTTDYILSDNGISGITTISFTGTTRESLPKGGIINEIEVGVGTGYTGGSYSNLTLIGGSGSGAKVDIVVGVGGSVLTYEIKNRGQGYQQNDILYLQSLTPVGINSATFKVLSTYNDKFSGWTFGELVKLDDFSNLFDGVTRTFTLTKTTGITQQPFSIEISEGSDLVLQNNLIIFINDFLQIPGRDYTFTGGTQVSFTEPPIPGSKLKILYYQGSSSDVSTEIPLQSIKIGDSVKLNSYSNLISQFDRIVTEITSSDEVETTEYNDVGISTNPQILRPLTWTKQTSDLIINSEVVSKSRDYLECRIRPTTRLIKDFLSGDSVMYVQSAYPEFNIIDNTNESSVDITIIKDNETSPAKVSVSNVSAAGTITSLAIEQSGSGFSTSVSIAFYDQNQIPEIGKTWTAGVTSTSSVILNDIEYSSDKFLYAICDESGGISTSKDTISWTRKTPSFTTSNQLNSISYGNHMWVGIGSNAKVGYSTNNTVSWNSGTIYSYIPEPGGLGRYQYTLSSTTRKFNSVAYGKNKFVAVGTGGTVLISDSVYPAPTTWLLDGVINESSPEKEGQQWFINIPSFVDINNNITSNVTNTLNSVIYSSVDERFVSVGNDGVIISSPIGAITNRQFRVDREPNASHENLNDIAYGNQVYVVVGDNGTVGYSTSLIGPWNVSTLSTSNDIKSVSFVNQVFVAVGENGFVANSLDGATWFIKNSLESTLYSITDNGNFIVGVGSDSKYFKSDSEITEANVSANIENGAITSFEIIDGGFGYTNASSIKVLVPDQSPIYENLTSVSSIGDNGKIIAIGTSATGIGTNSPMIIFSIQSNIGLNTTKYGATSQETPFVVRSGISTGDYFVTYNTITGSGVTSIDVTSGVTTIGISTEYLDCVYIASQVDNDGVSGIVTVYSNVISIVGVASTSVKVDSVGLDTTGKVGDYSWGKFYSFDIRQNPTSFTAYNKNGFSGISTSALIFRSKGLKAEYE